MSDRKEGLLMSNKIESKNGNMSINLETGNLTMKNTEWKEGK